MYFCFVGLTYKYRLKPSKSQVVVLNQWLGTCRFLYNICLEHRIHCWQSYRNTISSFDQNYQLKDCKKTAGLEWLANVHSQVLQEVIKRVERSFKNFFRGAGFPKWAKKFEYRSFTFTQVGSVRIEPKRIKLPKLGWFKFILHRPFQGNPKQLQVVKENNHWYICLVCEKVPLRQFKGENQAVGIDFGVKRLVSLSDGTYFENPLFLKQYQNRLRLLQRKLSRQVKRSHTWWKTKKQIKSLYAKISRCRKDYLHKVSHAIAAKYSLVFLENLQLKNMTKSAKGDVESLGRMVKQKSGLNRVLLDSGLGLLRSQIEYKVTCFGNTSHRVRSTYGSQTCSKCGCVSQANRKSQSVFQCINCSFAINADENAALNYLSAGTALWPLRYRLA